MTWHVTKAGFASLTSRAAWQRLAQGFAILFMLTHQAWAGIVCHCQKENDAQQGSQISHACCLAMHHSGSAVSTEQAGESTQTSCPEEGALDTDDQYPDGQSGILPQGAMVCCHEAPQAEKNAMISLQQPAPVVNIQPLVSHDGQSVSDFIPYNFHQLYRTRPLYLSFSCFLI